MSFKFRRLLRERKLMRIEPDSELALKEIRGAESDLDAAKESLRVENFKWATIQGYYSMFHSARALLYSRGFRERSHYALLVAVRELFSRDLEASLIRGFEDGMGLREAADYGLTFSEEGAKDVIENAEKLLFKAKKILNIS